MTNEGFCGIIYTERTKGVNSMKHHFICAVFLADGKHVSQAEPCDTAAEAMERAEKWRAVGHVAQAYREVIDLSTFEIHYFPLK